MSRSWDESKGSVSGYGSWIVMIVAVVIVLIAVLIGVGSCNRFDAGYAGVVIDYSRGTVNGRPSYDSVDTGRYFFVFPWELKRVVSYPISQQSLTMVRRVSEGKVQGDDSVECQDVRGIRINIDSSTLWAVDAAHVADLYFLRPNLPLVASNSENDIESQVVRREVRNAITTICGKFNYDEIYARNASSSAKASPRCSVRD